MTDIITAAATAAVLDACAQDPDIRILRRVGTLEEFPVSRRRTGPTRLVALIDTETTGTDVLTDEIIDIAVVTIEVDAKGEIVAIVSKGEALRDPGRELPEAITS